MEQGLEIGVVGSGPAAKAIEGAVSDADGELRRIDAEDIKDVDFVVVIDQVGSSVFGRVNESVRDGWISIELGGIGGRVVPEVRASLTMYGQTGCYECLCRRVESTSETEPEQVQEPTASDSRLIGAIAGWLLTSDEAFGDQSGHVVEIPYVERRLFPVPGCSCASTDDRRLSRSTDEFSLEESLNRVEPAIDERVGLVQTVGEAHSFPAPYYLATLCDTGVFSDAAVNRQAAGVAVDWNDAFMKCLGESLERYCAGVYRQSTFTKEPAMSVDDAVDPSQFVLPDQGYEPPDETEPIPWVTGIQLPSNRSVSVPAEFVYFPPVNHRHKPSITTGLGLGSSGVAAMLSGLLEVIERDATMLAWYSTFEPFELRTTDDGYETLVKRAKSEDLCVTPLLVTQDIDVPVVTVAVHRDGDWPQFAVGSKAALDPGLAARGALAEALQNWMEMNALGPDKVSEEAGAIGEYATFPIEAQEMIETHGTIQERSLVPDEIPTGEDALSTIVDRVTDVGLSVFTAPVTTRDVVLLGFEACRVLVPQAQPLFTDQPFFGDRANRVPDELGFEPALDRPHHPYP